MCLSLLAACGGGNDAVDPGFDNVVAAVEGAVSTDGMAQMDANYIENMFKLITDDYEQALVMATNVGTTIDEFGLFKGADSAQAEELHTAVNDYLKLRLDAWMPEYLPDELPKLQNAQVWKMCIRDRHMMSIKQSTPGETNRRRAHLPLPVSYFGFSCAFSCEMFPIEAFND